MNNFEKRVASKMRINGLEKKFMDVIESFSNENTELTQNEVIAVMLKMVIQFNDKEIRDTTV